MSAHSVNLSSLARNFPEAVAVPQLLKDFAHWLAKVPAGGVGDFEGLRSASLKSGCRQYARSRSANEQLGLFLLLHDGSWVALWAHSPRRAPAVVYLPTKSDPRLVASSLERFLTDLSQAKTGVWDLDCSERANQRTALASWLKKKRVKVPRAVVPDFNAWHRDAIAPSPRRGDQVVLTTLAAQALELVGQPIRSPAFRAFAEALGHWPPPKFGVGKPEVWVMDERGFSLTIGKPKDPTLTCVAFSSWSDDGQRAYSGDLPLGLTWDEKRRALHRRLGAPEAVAGTTARRRETWKRGRRSVTVAFGEKGTVLAVSVS